MGAMAAALVPVAGACGQRAFRAGGNTTINGIRCDTGERLAFQIHPHLAIYAGGQQLALPYGIGIGEPWHVQQTAEWPFLVAGSMLSLAAHTQAHELIQLDVGDETPPTPFTLPAGL
jgi:hypothetical protein